MRYEDDNECLRYSLFPNSGKRRGGREGRAKIFLSPTNTSQPWYAKKGYYFFIIVQVYTMTCSVGVYAYMIICNVGVCIYVMMCNVEVHELLYSHTHTHLSLFELF